MVVVGGGVAGVTCCQTLASTLASSQESKVVLVAASGLLKGVANVVKLARFTDSFDVVEQVERQEAGHLAGDVWGHIGERGRYPDAVQDLHEFDKISGPNTELVQGEALSIDVANKQLLLRDGEILFVSSTSAVRKSVGESMSCPDQQFASRPQGRLHEALHLHRREAEGV
eukprot:383051-Rhodomonas_salina.2